MNNSVVTYPGRTDRNWSKTGSNTSSQKFRNTILSKHYDFKESPRAFRYADSSAEKYVKNVVKNAEFDTEPNTGHN